MIIDYNHIIIMIIIIVIDYNYSNVGSDPIDYVCSIRIYNDNNNNNNDIDVEDTFLKGNRI